MKKVLNLLLLWFAALTIEAQNLPQQLQSDLRKAYGTDYPYSFKEHTLHKAPSGYKPFYISHYSRHGSRYYWNAVLYPELDTLLMVAHEKQLLTPIGEAFRAKFMEAKDELTSSVSELSDLGWEQHQYIARTMYNNFEDVFKKGGDVFAISSLSGRCVLSMASFCQELTQCNPKLEIREQSSRNTLDGVVPSDRQNPLRRTYPKSRPRFEDHRKDFQFHDNLRQKVISRVFTSTEGLPGNPGRIASNLINLYTSLPSIGHDGMMEGIISDDEIAARWENENLGSYTWVFEPRYDMIPILRDILKKADAVVSGSSKRVADLRFGHDTCLGPLTVLMGLNGADKDPEDPYEVKNCYQNWQTGKASNMQLIFYRSKKPGKEVLVKCLLNGAEATLPLPSDNYPYYKWSDFKRFYTERCNEVE
ncbi:MAG: hypothetical protein IKP43_01340 [Bacteroidaceae bacterium]|nr:hypothetical protein [Bacteroidaceae bacterium]